MSFIAYLAHDGGIWGAVCENFGEYHYVIKGSHCTDPRLNGKKGYLRPRIWKIVDWHQQTILFTNSNILPNRTVFNQHQQYILVFMDMAYVGNSMFVLTCPCDDYVICIFSNLERIFLEKCFINNCHVLKLLNNFWYLDPVLKICNSQPHQNFRNGILIEPQMTINNKVHCFQRLSSHKAQALQRQ